MRVPTRQNPENETQFEEIRRQTREKEYQQQVRLMKRIISGVIAFGIFIVIMTIVFGSWYTIAQTERGIVLRNGAYVDTAEPGLHFKMPWVSSVITWPVTQQVTYWTCNGGSTSCHEGEYREMPGYSNDQQPANLRVTISWHTPPDQVANAYKEYGTIANLESRLIARKAPQDIKTIFGQYTAQTVIQQRAKFNADVQALIEKDISGPVVIDSVQIENIDFSDAYEKSVEAAMQARVEVQRIEQQQQQQEVQARITIINAQAAADAKVAAAKGDAEATRLRGEAEATAIKARGDALRENPNLISLTQAEKWDGKLPTTMVPGSTVPFMNMDVAK